MHYWCCGCFNKAAFLMYAVYLQVHPTTYNKELSLLTVHKRTNMAQSLAYNHPITHNHQHTIIQSHSLAQSLAYNHSTISLYKTVHIIRHVTWHMTHKAWHDTWHMIHKAWQTTTKSLHNTNSTITGPQPH